MKTLKLSHDLSVPVDVATEALAWIGARGSGKTHGTGKLVELLVAAGVPVVVLDPVGVWYGLRLARDGKGPGLQIPVFGGLHGDVPLEATAGALVADLIVDKNLSAILDVSQFDTDAQRARFTADFAERLFTRKKKDPSVIHWVVDEAQETVPQNPQPGEQMMLHRMQRVLKLGRNFGIGVSLLTQRPQETSKKALNQCQTVLAFRLTGPQERKAMKDWIAAHDLDQALVEKLPSLETGTCHVWSPAFLKVNKEVRILPKDTFDASATPKFGERRAARELAPIDLVRLREAMAATLEKAKDEDPRLLRDRIRRLEADLAAKPAALKPLTVSLPPKRVEVPVLKEADIKRLEVALCKGSKVQEATLGALLAVAKVLDRYRPQTLGGFACGAPQVPRTTSEPRPGFTPRAAPAPRTFAAQARRGMEAGLPAHLSPMQQRILDALAQWATWGQATPTKVQVAFLADASPNGGSFGDQLGALRTAGLVDYPTPGKVVLRPEGAARANPAAAPQDVAALHQQVLAKLPPMRRRILEAALAKWPEAATRTEIAAAAGATASGGSFGDQLGALRSLGAVDYPGPGLVRAADALFPTGLAR